jgi:simple sugar transport system ATP-binding protein
MSTNFVHEKLFWLKAQGKSTLLVSEDLDETMKLCDRMIVMRSGKLVASFDGPNYDPYSIGSAMIGRGEVG